jgi:pimeloyl-ACP methyl ester carboxylesterase
MESVTSKDGTTIAFDRIGSGPPVVLVAGGSTDRSNNAPVGELLADDFTVLNYDRRGRGPSGDTQPYAVQREIEDLEAVIGAAGGSANVYGTSSGAALVLEAAAAGIAIDRAALWEPPYINDPAQRPPGDTAKTFHDLVAAGRRSDAVEFFMATVVGMPADFVAFAKTQSFWAATEKIAHTLEYDATIMGDYSVPLGKAEQVKAPTLLIVGGATFPFIHETADLLADAMPNGRVHTIEGATHDIAPDAIAPVLKEFFAS